MFKKPLYLTTLLILSGCFEFPQAYIGTYALSPEEGMLRVTVSKENLKIESANGIKEYKTVYEGFDQVGAQIKKGLGGVFIFPAQRHPWDRNIILSPAEPHAKSGLQVGVDDPQIMDIYVVEPNKGTFHESELEVYYDADLYHIRMDRGIVTSMNEITVTQMIGENAAYVSFMTPSIRFTSAILFRTPVDGKKYKDYEITLRK